MLLGVVSTEDWQSLADCCSHHERVCCTETIFIWLGQLELIEVQPELANIGSLLDGHLTSVSTILASRVLRVHKDCLILAGCATASELFTSS